MLSALNRLWKLFVSMRDAQGRLGKAFYRSKMLSVNAVAFVAAIGLHFAGVEMDGEAVLGFMAVINYALRLVTKEPVGFIDDTK